jgi:hypothetical protein
MATVVSMLCALALALGLAEPAPQALAAAADALTLLPVDQTPDNENDWVLLLVLTLGTAHLAQKARIVGPAPHALRPAGHGTVSDLARAPPPPPQIRFLWGFVSRAGSSKEEH